MRFDGLFLKQSGAFLTLLLVRMVFSISGF